MEFTIYSNVVYTFVIQLIVSKLKFKVGLFIRTTIRFLLAKIAMLRKVKAYTIVSDGGYCTQKECREFLLSKRETTENHRRLERRERSRFVYQDFTFNVDGFKTIHTHTHVYVHVLLIRT